MKNPTSAGLNRTGIGMSPVDSAAMLLGVATPTDVGDTSALYAMRREYLEDADRIGSVPIPSTLKGIAKTTLSKVKGDRPEVFLDQLGERLAFERGGTRLYDLLISKCQAIPDADLPIREFEKIRLDEAGHIHVVADVIKHMGGDPTVMTPGANVASIMTMGLFHVVQEPRMTVIQSLEAILAAELIDNDAWPLLIGLAAQLQMDEVVREFEAALAAEERHLVQIRALYNELVRGEAKFLH